MYNNDENYNVRSGEMKKIPVKISSNRRLGHFNEEGYRLVQMKCGFYHRKTINLASRFPQVLHLSKIM